MQAVFDRIDRVECVDDTCLYKLRIHEFDESIDSITIRTQIKETDLKRGWIGDLHWYTSKAFNVNCGDTEYVENDVFRDVILTHIKMYWPTDEPITWEYVFMKK